MTKRQTNKIITEKRLFITFMGVLVALVGLYMYLVSATVLHVVMQTEIDQEVKGLNSDISELENKYILAQHKVSSDIASMDGYTSISKKIFIDRAPDSLVLSTPSR